jgi:phytoene dehydrogenase-like protein
MTRGSLSIRNGVLRFYSLEEDGEIASFPIDSEKFRKIKDILYSLMISHSDLEKDGLYWQVESISDTCRLLREQESRDAAEIRRLQDLVNRAKPIVREFARTHPTWNEPPGWAVPQDPNGAHRWLADANAQNGGAQ